MSDDGREGRVGVSISVTWSSAARSYSRIPQEWTRLHLSPIDARMTRPCTISSLSVKQRRTFRLQYGTPTPKSIGAKSSDLETGSSTPIWASTTMM